MSRSLEKDLKISLQKEAAQKVYTSLVQEICKPRTSLLEIEFLGKSHPLPPGENFLLEESSIAIPKSKLVQAFTIARPILFKYNQSCLSEKEEEELLNATAIILLMDPEHLTAANTRKRTLKSRINTSNLNVKDLVNAELHFINSLLTSRLHRHTKSPTLWSHRRYILSLLLSHANPPALFHGPHPPPIGPDSPSYDILSDFKTIILIAASRHPKNYYAWSHARWLISTFSPDEKPVIPLIQDWVLRNPSDTSGFSFLYFLLSPPYATVERREVFRNILDLAISFKWTYESVWVFLRTLAAYDDKVYSNGKDFEREAGELVERYEEDSKEQATLRGAVLWYKEHAQEIR